MLKHGGQKYLDTDEWKALVNAGDFNQPDRPTYIGDSFRGAGNWVQLQYFRKTGLEQLFKKHLGTKAGAVVHDMITL